MSVIDDLLAEPTHDAAIRDVRVGAFFTVLSTEHGAGMAATLRDARAPHSQGLIRWAGELASHTARELAELLRSQSPMEASLGMAAVHALLGVPRREAVQQNAVDLLVRRSEGKRVAVVGHFPFIPKVRAVASHLAVLELDPGEGELPAGAAGETLPGAEVVAMTGTTIVNKTFETLLSYCSPQAFVTVIGPTTPLSEVLFDYGVDLIAGTRVVDAALAMALAGQGAIFTQMRGLRLMTIQKESRG
ncbi:MAG: DUF364 domain-containing protein [bacterium]